MQQSLEKRLSAAWMTLARAIWQALQVSSLAESIDSSLPTANQSHRPTLEPITAQWRFQKKRAAFAQHPDQERVRPEQLHKAQSSLR